MENKKLVNILLKDMGELEELVAEIKQRGKFDSLEIEFLHTRAKGIMQLLHMLNGYEEHEKEVPETIQKIAEEIQQKIPEENTSKTDPGNEAQMKEAFLTEEKIEEPAHEEKPAAETEEQPEEFQEETETRSETEEPVRDEETKEAENDEVELEEEKIIEVNQRLGDSFLKGKSVNDIIYDQNKLEFKLSNRPVSSIRSAIGINDRFQYIRELFDGSSDKFAETVASLDKMNNIYEAVTYLQQNFKWKKNETSLKFVNLVKRRFTHV
jgi:hypothetical protein